MYKYEPHLHTSEGSGCASTCGADMAKAHKEAGYDGIFITDHFFNGNSAVPRDLPWEDRIELYCKGYEHALEAGSELGLQVFFGVEFTVQGADFLLYGIDKKWLLEHEFYLTVGDERALFRLVHDDGGFIVHAHPFRDYPYIPHISLYPHDVDAVEWINASHGKDSEFNKNAKLYAEMYMLPVTGGSDTHSADRMFGGGILVPEKINCPEDYLRQLRNGSVVPIEPK
ncbi:MAG: PHP domain-containing protein [Lachnospiraceae bacterium]|nr:PHP domain-containing protein [Ruminococcus sp.]MCM1275962.1 PHP domain-containing protein [Lachnospiraceae bacterium]